MFVHVDVRDLGAHENKSRSNSPSDHNNWNGSECARRSLRGSKQGAPSFPTHVRRQDFKRIFLRRHNGTHFGAGFRPVFTENLNGILTIARGTWRWRFSARKTMLIDSASSSRIAQALALASVRGGQSGLSAFLYDWFFRGCERTFRPLHRGVVTTYALENGAAGDGDNRDHSLFAIRAARCSIHEILPIYTHNKELELLFHLSVTAKTGGCHGSRPGHARSARAAAGPSTLRYRQHASDVPIERSCRNRLTGACWEGDS
jgi:hypothetical protein